jgi:hypothetical protein
MTLDEQEALLNLFSAFLASVESYARKHGRSEELSLAMSEAAMGLMEIVANELKR